MFAFFLCVCVDINNLCAQWILFVNLLKIISFGHEFPLSDSTSFVLTRCDFPFQTCVFYRHWIGRVQFCEKGKTRSFVCFFEFEKKNKIKSGHAQSGERGQHFATQLFPRSLKRVSSASPSLPHICRGRLRDPTHLTTLSLCVLVCVPVLSVPIPSWTTPRRRRRRCVRITLPPIHPATIADTIQSRRF